MPENVARPFFQMPVSLLMSTFSIPRSKLRIHFLTYRVPKDLTLRTLTSPSSSHVQSVSSLISYLPFIAPLTQ